MEVAAKEIGDLAVSEEDVISYAIFPQVAEAFFKRRSGLEPPICATEKCGFPANKEKKATKKERDLEQIYLVDTGLLFEDIDMVAYPVA